MILQFSSSELDLNCLHIVSRNSSYQKSLRNSHDFVTRFPLSHTRFFYHLCIVQVYQL